MKLPRLLPALGLLSLSSACLPAEPSNLLRNGSFEGAMLYWHNLAPKDYELVSGDAPSGRSFLRLKSGYAMSAPFVAERGKWFTVSLFARGEGSVTVGMPPSAREVGTASKRLWTKEGGQSAKLTAGWKRLSFSWPADVPTDGFWPHPHYLVQIEGEKGKVIEVDGVTVTEGREGSAAYLPRREVEVVASCENLPGYAGAAGNTFESGATVRMNGFASNPGTVPRKVTVRWQLIDYEGEMPVSPPADTPVSLAAGETRAFPQAFVLSHHGLVYARFSVLDDKGSMVDKSDFPVTSLPYPKNATKPDYRERFGGSFAGGEQMLQKFQRLGFGWTRWFPETKWHNFQKKAGAPFDWHQPAFDLAARHGVSQHVVLYGWPEGLMDKEHSGQPLPLDMKWKADDPRWDDLSLDPAWDRYVKAAVENFRGKSVIFEIENEPEFDKWEGHHAEYARFTIRTARLIRATDPKARIMVNNVYGVPSPVNAAFFKAGGLKHVDVVSWHDYKAGWLADAQAIRRMRQNLDEAGGKHVELWFNEGWAFTNTAVDEPIAATPLTAAQSANAHAASVAEMSVAGQKKTILFHTGYETHGMSFWDYSGPGTCLWDWYDLPLPLVPMWNVLNHHLGLSEEIGFARPPGANLCVFQDLRNGRGVIVAYADRDSKADATVELPFEGLRAEDIMGNVTPAPKSLKLSRTGRPVLLHDGKTSGADFFRKLEPLDRKHLGFVEAGAASPVYRMASVWEGSEKGSVSGNPLAFNGKSVWRALRLYPADAIMAANYHPMVWGNQQWVAPDHSQGGHPSLRIEDGKVRLGALGPWGGQEFNYPKFPVLAFVAPADGVYRLTGKASVKPWDGGAKHFPFSLRKKDTQRAAEVRVWPLPRDASPVALEAEVELGAGHELLFVPMTHDLHNNAGTVTLEGLEIRVVK